MVMISAGRTPFLALHYRLCSPAAVVVIDLALGV